MVTRNPRLAPDTELRYGYGATLRNTPVNLTSYHIPISEEIFRDPKSFIPEGWIGRSDLEKYFVPF